jgi:hypothetical protein
VLRRNRVVGKENFLDFRIERAQRERQSPDAVRRAR